MSEGVRDKWTNKPRQNRSGNEENTGIGVGMVSLPLSICSSRHGTDTTE